MSEHLVCEMIRSLRKKVAELDYPGDSWGGYIALLEYLSAAIQRMPSLEDIAAFDVEAMELVIGTELVHLAEAIPTVLVGGSEEFAMYYLQLTVTKQLPRPEGPSSSFSLRPFSLLVSILQQQHRVTKAKETIAFINCFLVDPFHELLACECAYQQQQRRAR